VQAQGYVKAVGADGTGGVRITFLNAAGGEISWPASVPMTGSTGWVLLKTVQVAPALAVAARCDFYVYNNTVGYYQFDKASMQLQSSSVDEVPDGATYARPLASGLTNGGVNFASGVHVNKTLDNISDGTRKAVTAVDSNGKAIIDLSQSHLNKTLDNIADSANFAKVPAGSAPAVGAGRFGATPTAITTDSTVNYGTTVLTSNAWPAGVNTTNVYARWEGYLVPTVSGTYTIGVNSDDGASLYIGSVPVVNNLATMQGSNSTLAYTQSGTIALVAGTHYPLVLEYQEGTGGYEIQLAWTVPGGSIALIPSANLSTSATAVTGNLTGRWWNGTSLLWYPTGSNFIDFSAAHVNKTAGSIPYASGATLESLKPAQAGADVTANNTAAAIVGQGVLATLNQVTQTTIADNSISTGKLQANTIQTSNYTQDGSGNPTAGAKMDITGTALKVQSGGLQMGSYIFTDYWYRLGNAIDGSQAVNIYVWRGNNDTTTLGGAPNASCLHIFAMNGGWNGTYFSQDYVWELRPTATTAVNNIIPPGSDNLDSMRYMSVTFYNSSQATIYTTKVVLHDRLYRVGPSYLNTDNSSFGQFQFLAKSNYGQSGGIAQFNGYMRTQLFNTYGPSATHDFSIAGNSLGVELGTTTLSVGGGSTGGGGAGGTGGGGCPAPWVKITLASGAKVDAGDVHKGMKVMGVDESTFKPSVGTVDHVTTIWRPRYAVSFVDGRCSEYSKDHRFGVLDRGWIAIQDLRPGDTLIATKESIVAKVVPTGLAQVISFNVLGCHTYFSDDVLSHNQKMLTS
jgi:hypothetical protein